MLLLLAVGCCCIWGAGLALLDGGPGEALSAADETVTIGFVTDIATICGCCCGCCNGCCGDGIISTTVVVVAAAAAGGGGVADLRACAVTCCCGVVVICGADCVISHGCCGACCSC